jgi:hypothetical protein
MGMRHPYTVCFALCVAGAHGLRRVVDVHGFSVSPSGFVALLADRERDRWMPLQVTSEDKESAQSVEALTLLQMIQGIDLAGVVLPPELLTMRAGANAQLRSVCLRDGSSCVLVVVDGSGTEAVEAEANTFEGLALAMRYGAPIEVDGLVAGQRATQ